MGGAWQSAAVALAVGLLVGSERERSGSAGGALAGVRTFGLAALAGCAAALIAPVVLAATVLGAAGLVSVGYLRATAAEAGVTTEVALVLTTALGGLAVTRPALAAGAGVATAVVLLSRDRLHRFVREHITDIEMTDALKFFVVAFIVLPLVPHARLGPDGVIDPRTIWTLVVAVTALGWLGYVAVRVLGPRRGLPVAGLAGGFVSGAATTGAMARLARSPGLHRPALAAALLASVATLVQLVIVTAVADRRVALTLAPAAAIGALVLAAEAAWLSQRGRPDAGEDETEDDDDVAPVGPTPARVPSRRPFALIPAVLLAGILTLLLVLATLANHALGRGGTILAISAAGLADAHAGALTAATLAAGGGLSVPTAALAAAGALGVNTLTKLVLAFVAGGRQIGAEIAALYAGPIVGVALGLAATLGLSG